MTTRGKLEAAPRLLACAKASRAVLHGAARRQARRCLDGWRGPAGGFVGRDDADDLYYTAFGLLAALALGGGVRRTRLRRYEHSFGAGDALDLVHLSCLWQIRAALWLPWHRGFEGAEGLESFRCDDGLYGGERSHAVGSVYATYLALLAYSAWGREPPRAERIPPALRRLCSEEGGFRNRRDQETPVLPTTTAALVVLADFGSSIPDRALDWVRACWSPRGGFQPQPGTGCPDLLCTATALVALERAGCTDWEPLESCLGFVESLWTDHGFMPAPGQEVFDVEYLVYGLLALGTLAGMLGMG